MVKTCWSNKTPFQMALLLILCFAIPFLVIMVIIYVLFSTVWFRSEKCVRLCNINLIEARSRYIGVDKPDDVSPAIIIPWPTGMYDGLSSTPTHPPTRSKYKQRRRAHKYDFHSLPVVALLENLHSDEETEMKIVCSMAMISNIWALTTYRCIQNHLNHLDELSVRIGSNYWSQSGVIVKIKEVVPYGRLVAVRLENGGVDPTTASIFDMDLPLNCAPLKAFAVSWSGSLSAPLERRKKFKIAEIVDVELFCDDVGQRKVENKCCEEDSPLFDESRSFLIGFQTLVNCEKKSFSYFTINEYRDWLMYLLRTFN